MCAVVAQHKCNPHVQFLVYLGNTECVALGEEKKNADTTHSAQVTVRLKRPAAGSSTPKMKGKDKAVSLAC